MIYTTADRLEHLASALGAISPEWAMQLKGYANYIRGLEKRNIDLHTENRELQELVDNEAAKINEEELDAFAARIRAGEMAREDVIAIELSNLDIIEAMDLPPCGETLSDLIESLQHMGQP